jgi:hypothetical protein
MPLKGFTSEQIIRLLRETVILIREDSMNREAVRQIGVIEQAYHKCRSESVV